MYLFTCDEPVYAILDALEPLFLAGGRLNREHHIALRRHKTALHRPRMRKLQNNGMMIDRYMQMKWSCERIILMMKRMSYFAIENIIRNTNISILLVLVKRPVGNIDNLQIWPQLNRLPSIILSTISERMKS